MSWIAVVSEAPEPNDEYPTDPQDWMVELQLVDEEIKQVYEVIYVTFTGTIGEDDAVIMTPEEVVEERIESMLKGLNG